MHFNLDKSVTTQGEKEMAETKKMCDMPEKIAATVLQMLNGGVSKIELRWHRNSKYNNCHASPMCFTIVTDIEPKNLVYPEGWYYSSGYFSNKYCSTTGVYSEVYMEKFNGTPWEKLATYRTI